MNGSNAWMVERRQRLRFALEPYTTLGIEGNRKWEHLEGDFASETRVAGAIHYPHAALCPECRNLVRSKTVANGRWHRERILAHRTATFIMPHGLVRGL